MRPIVSAEEMRRADAAAIDAGTPADELMERAGRAVARTALRLAGKRYGARCVVVCGPGNNGGDGYVAARQLRAAGASVACLTVTEPPGSGGAARTSYDRLREAGGTVHPFESRRLQGADVIVDAIFGTGFHGEPRGAARAAITAIEEARSAEQSDAKVLSVDVPSGVGGPGPLVHSDVTLALGAEKLETAVLGREVADVVEVADIGIAISSTDARMTGPEDLAGVAERRFDAHKWKRSVLILAGSDAMTGAAVLATRGAFRAGAGYVTLATTPGAEAVARRLVPEVVVRVPSEDPVLGPRVVEELKESFERAGAVALGPGLGTGDAQRALVRRVVEEVDKPVILDADGLNVLSDDADVLRRRGAPLAITPHAGELARLLGTSADDIQADRVGAVRDAASRFGCAVLLKGPRTLVCQSERGLVINPTGGPELATAGTGDVLTGVAVALAAGGADAFEPAWQAAYLHGYGAGIASRRNGRVGLVAWDVAEALALAIAQLALS